MGARHWSAAWSAALLMAGGWLVGAAPALAGSPALARAPGSPFVTGSNAAPAAFSPIGRSLSSAGSFANAASVFEAAAPAAPLPRLIAAGNLPGCLEGTLKNPAPLMRSFHATILRVVVSPSWPGNLGGGARGQALPCLKAARREGYKVMLVIEWNGAWSPGRVRQLFSRVLRTYGTYLWAVGVGNEEEITEEEMSPHLTGSGYSRDWKAVEPLLKRMVPHAIRVAGEISPWGLAYLEAALRAGLPGMQALAVHPYGYAWEFTIQQVLALADRYRVPLWCDEGVYEGPNSWLPVSPPGAKFMPLSALRGAVLAGVWDRL